MMQTLKCFLLSLAISFCHFTSHAQQNKISGERSLTVDSLLSLLHSPDSRLHDTSRINTLNDLAWELQNNDLDTAITLSLKALYLAQKNKFYIGIGKSLHQLGVFNWLKANYNIALDFDFKALDIWEKLEKDSTLYPKSLILTCKSGTLGNIGIVYKNQGNSPQALEYYFKALKIAERLKNKKKIVTKLGNIGNVYKEQGDFQKALDYYFKALKLAEELQNKNLIALWLGNIGNIYDDLGKPLKALDYDFKALKIDEELGNKNGIAHHLSNIGVIYYNKAKNAKSAQDLAGKDSLYKKALTNYLKALEMMQELGNKREIATDLGNIGKVYFSLKRYKEAEEYLQRGLTLSTEIDALNLVKNHDQYLSELYEITNQPAKALLYYKKYIAVRDSIFNEENTKKTVRSEMNFEFDKKEALNKKELTILKKEQQIAENKKYFLIITIIFLCLLAASLISRQQIKLKKQTLQHEIEQKLIEAKLERNKLETQKLEADLQLNHEKLISHTNLIKEKTRLLENMQEQLNEIRSKNIGLTEPTAEYLLNAIKENINSGEYWEEFITNFNLVYKNFMDKLIKECPDLSKNELKLCALIKCNLGNKEIANVIHISPDSVKRARNRLKQKLKLEESKSLTTYIMSLNLAL